MCGRTSVQDIITIRGRKYTKQHCICRGTSEQHIILNGEQNIPFLSRGTSVQDIIGKRGRKYTMHHCYMQGHI